MLRISNLWSSASMAGKQPPLSFQFSDSLQIFFSERQSEPKFFQWIFVTPERIELSTPSLKDWCSNQLSYEIIFAELWIVNRQLATLIKFLKIHLRSKIHISQLTIFPLTFWVSSGIEPCFPVPQTDALPNKLKKP